MCCVHYVCVRNCRESKFTVLHSFVGHDVVVGGRFPSLPTRLHLCVGDKEEEEGVKEKELEQEGDGGVREKTTAPAFLA